MEKFLLGSLSRSFHFCNLFHTPSSSWPSFWWWPGCALQAGGATHQALQILCPWVPLICSSPTSSPSQTEKCQFSPFPEWFFLLKYSFDEPVVGGNYVFWCFQDINVLQNSCHNSSQSAVLSSQGVFPSSVLGNPLPMWTNSFSSNISRPAAPLHITHWMYLMDNSGGCWSCLMAAMFLQSHSQSRTGLGSRQEGALPYFKI